MKICILMEEVESIISQTGLYIHFWVLYLPYFQQLSLLSEYLFHCKTDFTKKWNLIFNYRVNIGKMF